MIRLLPAVLVFTTLTGCSAFDRAAPGDAAAIADAVAHADRPDADRARDGDRKPQQVMELMGVRPGQTIIDLMAGGGYYTELLARAVGPEGTVHLQNTPYVINRFAGKALGFRLQNNRLPNVKRIDCELTALPLDDASIDSAFMVLFYHDTYWMGIDRAKMLREIVRVLKPGGTFALIDHAAAAGSFDRDVKTLHRVDEALVMNELLAAGFIVDKTSDLLRHPEDDHTINVFDKNIRGKTDRFVYKLRKPWE